MVVAAGDNFILDFAELCEGTEIPEQFAVWSGVAGVSLALGRQVWLELGTLTIYPNMFICFVAGSGQMRKSTSIDQLAKVVYKMNPMPNLIAQKITPEALIDAMRIKEINDSKHLLQDKNQGFILLDELTSLMTRTTYEGLSPLLLQFYNCMDSFEYQTKSGGKQPLKNTCLGFLAATTPASLTNAIPETAIGDGLTSRIVFVYVDSPTSPVPIPQDSPRKRELRDSLERGIQRITLLQGPVRFTEEAEEIYIKDYMTFRSQREGIFLTNPLLAGYAGRRHVHILKLATILCCSEADQLYIRSDHIMRAIDLVKLYEQALPSLVQLISSSQHGLVVQQVLDMVKHGPEGVATRPDILRRLSHRVSSKELDSVLETLERSNCIRTIINGHSINYQFLKVR